MRFRKTRSDSRSTYIYRFDDGTSVTLCPGENGVTEADIKMLHSLDDAEVYNNIKNSRPPMTSEEKVKKQRWQEGHSGERYSAGWNLSLDCAVSDCKDKGRILYEVSAETEYEEETAEEMMKRVLWFLTDTQREVCRLVMLEGYTQTEVAKLTGTSIPNVNKHLKRATKKINEQVKNPLKFFDCDM